MITLLLLANWMAVVNSCELLVRSKLMLTTSRVVLHRIINRGQDVRKIDVPFSREAFKRQNLCGRRHQVNHAITIVPCPNAAYC